jgi:hypothetical protein
MPCLASARQGIAFYFASSRSKNLWGSTFPSVNGPASGQNYRDFDQFFGK